MTKITKQMQEWGDDSRQAVNCCVNVFFFLRN